MIGPDEGDAASKFCRLAMAEFGCRFWVFHSHFFPGPSVAGLVVLLTKEFTRLVMMAFVLAGPVAYFAMNRWLESFAYRVEVGPMVFVVALVSVLVIAWMSVSYQAFRAARANPVQSLKYE